MEGNVVVLYAAAEAALHQLSGEVFIRLALLELVGWLKQAILCQSHFWSNAKPVKCHCLFVCMCVSVRACVCLCVLQDRILGISARLIGNGLSPIF